jgi:hypothetical protein
LVERWRTDELDVRFALLCKFAGGDWPRVREGNINKVEIYGDANNDGVVEAL